MGITRHYRQQLAEFELWMQCSCHPWHCMLAEKRKTAFITPLVYKAAVQYK